MQPGLLFVTMQPGENLPGSSFHDWYNNEHGPIRLRLPFVKNGFRYRAIDLKGAPKSRGLPEWLAIYDITDMQELNREPYLRLRREDVKSPREKATMKQIRIDRRLYDLAEEEKGENYVPLEDTLDFDTPKTRRVLQSIFYTIETGNYHDFERWYREEHIPNIRSRPGWLRSRRFITSALEPKDPMEHLVLHEFEPESSLDRVSAVETQDFGAQTVSLRRIYEHFYTFGSAPRDLASLADASTFTSPDGRTKAIPASASPFLVPAIESYITTADGVDLPYTLEGSTDPSAQTIVLSNSILNHFSIWDGFLAEFFSDPSNRKRYRVLRYLTRGRYSNCGDKQITIDVLATDIITLLDTLRVKKAAALIGVSLGGATVLNAAITYPDRVGAFIACDTNSKSPEGNKKAWTDRIVVAAKEGALSPSGEPIVGDQLADMTVKRWFVKESFDGGRKQDLIQQVAKMVSENSLSGFQKGVEALFDYDLRDKMSQSSARGAFLVGAGDGILPKTMKEMMGQMNPAADTAYHVIDEAGHLPMVEQPKRFAQIVGNILASIAE